MGKGHPSGYGETIHIKTALLPYLTPWAAVVAAGPLAWLTHQVWDTPAAAPWAAIALTLATIALTYVTHQAGRARGRLIRNVATAAMLGCGAWLTAATFAGPFHHPWVDLWAIGGVVLAGSINMLRVLRGTGLDARGSDDLGELAEQIAALKGMRLRNPKVIGGKVTAEVEMAPGVPIGDLTAARKAVASQLDVPVTGVRVTESIESGRRGRLDVTPVDQLRVPQSWPGPSAPGKSIAEPVVLGVREDGSLLKFWLPGDPSVSRNGTHVLVVGMSGAGKTEGVLILAVEVMSRVDVEVWFIDFIKGEQTYGPIKHGVARLGDTEAKAERMLDDLVDVEIPKRTQYLGERGHTQWVPGCGLPYLVVFVEEAAALVAGNGRAVEAAERARSAGISLVFSLQRPTHTRIPTDARSNFGAVLCFGVKEDRDARFALSDMTIDAGASPDAWRNNKPGYLYLEAPGVDEEEWSLPARTFRAERAALAAAVTPVGSVPESPVSASDGDQGGDDAEESLAIDPDDPPDEVDPAKPIQVDDRTPVLSFDPPPSIRRPTTGEARVMVDSKIRQLAAAGVDYLAPSDMADVLEMTQRSAPWLSGELKARCGGPNPLLATTERGVYRILVPAQASA